MFKKLDTLILKAFIGPFIATFFITLFVLVLQFFWLYIDDLVGKGLEANAIVKFTGYVTATMIPLAIPLAILISSIMTFGNLGESFELVAIKSAGIPLLRFMRPLLITSILIGSAAFLISNYVVPVAKMKMTSMLYDIRIAKPAFDIKEGIFYDKIPGYAIKLGKKEKDGVSIKDIIIYESQFSLQDNFIVAEKGVMQISEDKKFLEFDLENGWRYQEKGTYNTPNTDYYRMRFKKFKKVFDLSSFDVLKTPDSLFKNDFNMLSVKQLDKASDTLKTSIQKMVDERMQKEVTTYLNSGRLLAAGWKTENLEWKNKAKGYGSTLPDSTVQSVYARAVDKISLIKSSLDLIHADFIQKRKELNFFRMEWHKKFSLSFACIVLFIIGAPLGSIIRKGGLGMPLVIAVVFFLIFHLLNIFGEKFVKEGILDPILGIWLASYVLVPVGVFLVYKATNDSQLLNYEAYFKFIKKIKLPFQKAYNEKS